MTNLSSLLLGILFGFLAQIVNFFQLQGRMKWAWFEDHYWLTVLMGIPVSMLFMYSVKEMVIAFNGQMWPSRLIGFSIGAIVFSLMSHFIFGEVMTAKTWVCLGLAVVILLVQLFWK